MKRTKRMGLVALAAGAAVLLAAALAWLWATRLFEEPEAALVPSIAGAFDAGRVLAVFAHPDDEQLITALLEAAHRGGIETALIVATRGEAGQRSGAVPADADLGAVRMAEVEANAAALGVESVEVWSYPDGGLEDADFDALVLKIADAIREMRPDMLVTFWPESGATGHRDHMTIGRAAAQAAAITAAEGAGPSHIAYPLMPRRVMRRLGGERGRFVAANQPAPSHRMPADAAAKLRGWEIHLSQEDFVRRSYGVPTPLLYRLFTEEFYRVEEPGR